MAGEEALTRDQAKADRFLKHLEPLQGALESYGRRLLLDQNAVADVLQSAVANAYRDFDLYAEGTNFRAWIFQYLHLEILNANRKQRREQHQDLPEDLPAEEVSPPAGDELVPLALLEDPEAVLDHCDDAVVRAVRGLREWERSVFLLQAIGEFTYREIADILQVPLGTVMSGLARARLRLRQQLAQYGEQHGLLKRPSS
jgi:RNA polymerase sigma-70 factor (ECF subfamily)